MKHTELPFEEKPYLSMYQNLAFPLGIVQANARRAGLDITPWLCGKYINCMYTDVWPDRRFSICTHDEWYQADAVFSMRSILLTPAFYQALQIDRMDLLKRMLDQGYYVCGTFNEQYIPGKSSYQHAYFPHGFLLFGYHDPDGYFSAAGYLSDGYFHSFRVSYADFWNAILTVRQEKCGFDFYRYRPDATFPLRVDIIRQELHDYLHSTSTVVQKQKRAKYGLCAVEAWKQYFCACMEENRMDLRYTKGLLEHKLLMHMRVQYLYAHGYLSDPGWVKAAQSVYRKMTQFHLIALKYTVQQRIRSTQFLELIDEALETEKAYLPELLQELTKRNEDQHDA